MAITVKDNNLLDKIIDKSLYFLDCCGYSPLNKPTTIKHIIRFIAITGILLLVLLVNVGFFMEPLNLAIATKFLETESLVLGVLVKFIILIYYKNTLVILLTDEQSGLFSKMGNIEEEEKSSIERAMKIVYLYIKTFGAYVFILCSMVFLATIIKKKHTIYCWNTESSSYIHEGLIYVLECHFMLVSGLLSMGFEGLLLGLCARTFLNFRYLKIYVSNFNPKNIQQLKMCINYHVQSYE